MEKQGRSHIFWHNAIMGLCAHPDLAKKYEIGFRDETIAWLIEKDLKTRGDEGSWQWLFSQPNYTRDNWNNFDWVTYEPIARGLFCRLATDNIWSMVEVFCFYKPEVFLDTLAWAFGFTNIEKTDPFQPGTFCSDRDRIEKGIYLRPFRWRFLICSLMMFVVVITSKTCRKKLILCGKPSTWLMLLMLLGASLPCIAVIPNLMYGTPLIIITIWGIYSLIFRVLVATTGFLQSL